MVTFSDEKIGLRVVVAEGVESDIVHFAQGRLGLNLNARQLEVLGSEAKRGILNCSRQWGKSTLAAAKAVYRAYTRPESLVLVASPGERQSVLLVEKAGGMLRRLGIRPGGGRSGDYALVLPNGSRIVALPGTEATVRGFSAVSLLLIDEASRMGDGMYKALRPMLAVGGGDLWMMSTPWGRRGFFYETWEHGGPGWERVRGPATEAAHLTKEYLEEERGVQGAWFAQEYMCEFLDRSGGMFGRALVEAALDDGVNPLEFGGLWKS